MERLNHEDWAVFVDRDAWFPHPHYFKLIDHHSKGEYGLLTCMTNRVGTNYQCVKGMWKEEDISKHVNKALDMGDDTGVIDITDKSPLSGVLIMIKKSEWEKTKGFDNGILGVDNSIHYAFRDAGLKVGLMTGVYLWHYYRNGDRFNTKHIDSIHSDNR